MTFSKNDTARVKGIAILMLLFHHLFYNPKLIEQREIVFHFVPQEKITAVAIGARICVWIFVFLSAYGLASQYRNCIQDTARGADNSQLLCKKMALAY